MLVSIGQTRNQKNPLSHRKSFHSKNSSMHSVSKETGKQQVLKKIFSSEILTVIDGETQFVSDVSLFEYLYWC